MTEKERVRLYTKAFLTLFFCSAFAYMMGTHVGMDEGSVKAETVYSFITGIIAGTVLSDYFTK